MQAILQHTIITRMIWFNSYFVQSTKTACIITIQLETDKQTREQKKTKQRQSSNHFVLYLACFSMSKKWHYFKPKKKFNLIHKILYLN